MKKVLIASPTADIKDYCFDLWMENVSKFTYENSQLFLCDNSNTRDYFFDIKKDMSIWEIFLMFLALLHLNMKNLI